MDLLSLSALFLIAFVGLIFYFTRRVRAGQLPILRQIQAYETLKGVSARAIEAGRNLHLSLGVGTVTNDTTADTLAGLSILAYLSEKAAATASPPIVSLADPMAMLMAQSVTKAAQTDDPDGAELAQQNVRWVAPQPAAYAAGVMNLIHLEETDANILVGNFGDEYLLMGETAARQGGSHIGGSSVPNTLPFIYASAQETLIGEEIYAAGAYLQKRPVHLGSLMAQDTLRTIIFWVILIGVILASLP